MNFIKTKNRWNTFLVVLMLTLVVVALGSPPTPARAADVNLRGYWALDGNANDSSGYGYNGTLTGGSWSASHASTTFANTGSLSLDGSSGQGVNTDAPVTTATNNVSLSAWVNWAGANGNYQAILYNGNSGTSGYGVFVDSTGLVTILNGGIGFAGSTFALTSGVWQYVVAMRDAGVWKLYVDGNQVALTGNPAPNPPSDATSIGRTSVTSTNTFNGLIDEARIYDRVLTSTETCSPAITVSNANDSGAGSLRNAIAGVCSGGTITFNGDHTILLASELAINKNMTIDGAGHNVTVSGNHAVRVFNLTGGTITMNRLTVADGYFVDGSYSGDSGAGIRVNGSTLNLTNSTVSGNVTGWPGGGGMELRAGAANVSNSAFIGNSGNYGGGIDSASSTTLNVSNSTFSGNSADNAGGGLSVGGTGNIINSTISGNSAGWIDGGGGLNNEDGAVTVSNSIIANNPTGGNCFNHYPEFSLIVGVNSLANDASCGAGFTNSASILLGTLGNYGGSTQTFPLLPGSSAIDSGDDAICAAAPVNSLDQRGVTRPQGSACDIGAFESRGFMLAKTGGDNQSAAVNTQFATRLGLNVTSAFGEPVAGGVTTFTAPLSGAGIADTTPFTKTIGADGTVSAIVTANGAVGGPYLVNAGARGASSVDFSLTNTPIGTATSLVSSLNPAQFGHSVTFTATVSPAPTGGTVAFKDNGADIGGCGMQAVTAGQATCSTASFTSGTHSVTAFYSGAASYSASDNSASPLSQVVMLSPPVISAAFGATPIAINSPTSLSFSLTNPAANSQSLTGVGFTTTLPAGLVVASPSGAGNNCGGTATAVAGSGSISLSDATLAVGGSCTFSVNVAGSTAGSYTVVTGNVSALESGSGGTASASLVIAPTQGVTAVVMDPAAAGTLYAAQDGGVWKSTDGGATWTAATIQPANQRVKGLVIHPATRSTLFAATYGGGAYTSTDSGVTWNPCANGGLSGSSLNAVSLAIDSSGNLYAGTEAGIFTSPDCGSWSAVNSGLTVNAATSPVTIAVDSTTPAILYAGLDGAGVFRSANSGGSWTAATTQPTNPRVKALVISRTDSTKLYAATYGGGVFASTDSGDHWTVCANTNLTNLNVLSLTMDGNGRLYAGTEGGVFVSADACATWNAINGGLP